MWRSLAQQRRRLWHTHEVKVTKTLAAPGNQDAVHVVAYRMQSPALASVASQADCRADCDIKPAPTQAHLQVVVPLAPPRGVLRPRRLQRVHQRALHGVVPPPFLVAAGQHPARIARCRRRTAFCLAIRVAVRGCVLAVRLARASRTPPPPARQAVSAWCMVQAKGGQRLRRIEGIRVATAAAAAAPRPLPRRLQHILQLRRASLPLPGELLRASPHLSGLSLVLPLPDG